jgi:hypothetical protein
VHPLLIGHNLLARDARNFSYLEGNETQIKGASLMSGRVKVKLSLCFFLTEHNATKAYWGVEVHLHAFLSSALDGVE